MRQHLPQPQFVKRGKYKYEYIFTTKKESRLYASQFEEYGIEELPNGMFKLVVEIDHYEEMCDNEH